MLSADRCRTSSFEKWSDTRNLLFLPVSGLFLLVCGLLFLSGPITVHAAGFTAVKSGNWNDPITWGGATPGQFDTVTIPSPFTVTIPPSSLVTLGGALTVNSGGHLAVNDGAIDNFGTVTVNVGGIIDSGGSIITNENGGTITNNGFIFGGHDGTITNNGTITNTGAIRIGANIGALFVGGTMTNNSFGTITSSGTITNLPFSTITNTFGTITSSGAIDNFGTIANIAGFITNSGLITNNGGGTMTNLGDMSNVCTCGGTGNNGTITNSGTIDNGGTNIGGTIIGNGLITNSGFITNKSGGTINNNSVAGLGQTFRGQIDNLFGFISNNAGATFGNAGVIRNEGDIFDVAAVATISNDAGATFSNTGTIYNRCNAQLVGLENLGGTINEILCEPFLLTPSNGSTSSTSTPTFTWQDNVELRTNVQYEWQIAKGSDPNTPIQTASPLSTTSHTADSLSPGTYVWKVQAVSASVPLGRTVFPSGFSFPFTLTVVAPVTITAPPDIVVSTDPNVCSAVVSAATLGTATSSGGVPPVSIVSNPPGGTVFPLGATKVTWTATDSSSTPSIATATQTVTVIDNQPPTITAPPSVTVVVGTPSAAIRTATATDNCPGVTVTNNAPATFSTAGTTTVTWTATDTGGNIASATQTVTVVRTTKTTIAPSPSSVIIGNKITYTTTVSDTSVGQLSAPTGMVTFSDGGKGGSFSISGLPATSCTLSSTASCAITYSPPAAAGFITITGAYTGDSIHSGSSGTSSLTVLTPAQATQDLTTTINGMNLPMGTTTSLTTKLDAAIASLKAGDCMSAEQSLIALINEAMALSGKMLTVAQANQLIATAQGIINSLPC